MRIIFGRYAFVVTVDVVLVCGKQSLYEEGRFDEVTAVIFLPEGFHFSGISIPPVWISTVEAVGFFEEGNYLFHTGETFGTGDVTTVNTGNQGHDAEATAAGGDDVLIFFGIDAVHVDAFGSKTAVGFGTLPEVVEGSALDSVHEGIIGKRGGTAGFRVLAASKKEEEEEGKKVLRYMLHINKGLMSE